MKSADVLVFGAHPDDLEIGCGGTVANLARSGRRVVLVDLTRGELATRGTPEIRAAEADAALRALGAADRVNLGLPDGGIAADPRATALIAGVVRRHRPQMVLLPHIEDRHPDHMAAGRLVYEGVFLAGVQKFAAAPAGVAPHRPGRLLSYMIWHAFSPDVIVEVPEPQAEAKMRAIRAYATQFLASAAPDPETRLTDPRTLDAIESRMAYLGSLIGARHGEGFLIHGHLRVDDPLALSFETF